MGSSAGRRDKAYLEAKAEYAVTRPPCWMNSGAWCTGVGLSPDHDPPLNGTDVNVWRARGGRLRPACLPCQSRQGAAIRNRTKRWKL